MNTLPQLNCGDKVRVTQYLLIIACSKTAYKQSMASMTIIERSTLKVIMHDTDMNYNTKGNMSFADDIGVSEHYFPSNGLVQTYVFANWRSSR